MKIILKTRTAAVRALSGFMSNPDKHHWKGLEHGAIAGYIKGTKLKGLLYVGEPESLRRSSIGCSIFTMGCCSIVEWHMAKHIMMSDSSREAEEYEELVAKCAGKGTKFFQMLLGELNLAELPDGLLFEDSAGANFWRQISK